MSDANELKRMIEDLSKRLSCAEAIHGDEVAALEQRIEKLEGKERSAVYDPATNSVAEATVDTLSIRGCKVKPKPSEADIKIAVEHAARLAADDLAESLKQVSSCFERPGGLVEQFETAQRESEKRLTDLDSSVTDIEVQLDKLKLANDLAKKPAPERVDILQPSGEKTLIYIVDGRVFFPADMVESIGPIQKIDSGRF